MALIDRFVGELLPDFKRQGRSAKATATKSETWGAKYSTYNSFLLV